MLNTSHIHSLNEFKSKHTNLSERYKPIQANSHILKAHHYSLNHINRMNKSNKSNHLISPFGLFSKSAPIVPTFKLSSIQPSQSLDKITAIGGQKNQLNPFQDFIQSLAVPKADSSLASPKKEESISLESSHQVVKAPVLNTPFSSDIIKITKENNEFVTVRIRRPKDWNFQPGQYLEIRAEGSNAKKPAVLAIASGFNDSYIEITGKPSNDPNHANYFLSNPVGTRLIVNGPFGSQFPLNLITPMTPVVLIGGGSGLTALKSLLDTLPQSIHTTLIYSTKTYSDLIYKDQMEQLISEGHTISFTQDSRPGFAEGRITQHISPSDLKPNSLYFLCGPNQLVLETAKALVAMGVPRESIYGSLAVMAKDGGPVFRGDHPRMLLA